MKTMISKFFNKECKVDLDLLVELKCRKYMAKSFYKYLVIDKVVKEIWISEKDNNFLVELRDANCSIQCKRELKDAKTIDIDSIINKKRATKIATLDSKRELLKFLKKNF